MVRCGMEMCAYWTGFGCACDVLGLEREEPILMEDDDE